MLIYGTRYGERLDGGSTADRIYGYGGSDYIVGWGGNDRLVGGTGHDTLWGQNGEDILHGGRGVDLMYGGAGADAFVFDTRPPTGVTEMDVIADFSRRERDMIAIDNNYYPNLGADGWLPSYRFKVVGYGGTLDANDRLVYNARTGVLAYDWNGWAEGGRVVLARLEDAPTLTAADIFVL